MRAAKWCEGASNYHTSVDPILSNLALCKMCLYKKAANDIVIVDRLLRIHNSFISNLDPQ